MALLLLALALMARGNVAHTQRRFESHSVALFIMGPKLETQHAIKILSGA